MERWTVAMQVVLGVLGWASLCVGAPTSAHVWKDGRPVVEVEEGTIKGIVTTHGNFTYLAFNGIPYAMPPTHHRRFKDPEPIGPWTGELDASEFPHPCTQFTVLGREDCLYLNVFTPLEALEVEEPLPVMVFIHGGAFYLGGSRTYFGTNFLVEKGVIVVTLNYRLGVLGFFSTEDLAAPGNQGLKDQTLALRWVKNNIASFGGDIERITIFGESAGAASVHYQMLAPSAAGLFSGAIMQSGSALSPWSRGRKFSQTANTIAERFDCPTESTDDLVTCLQKVNHRLLDEMVASFMEWNFQPVIFAPRVDGEYIPDEPIKLMKEGRYHHVPTLMGINKHEGALTSMELYVDPLLLNTLSNNFSFAGPISLELYEDEEPLQTASDVYKYYLDGLNFGKENADNLTQLHSDRFFLVPMDWLARLTADTNLVYMWELHHVGKRGMKDLFFALGLDLDNAHDYICHGDDLHYIFSTGIKGSLSRPEDKFVSDLFTTLWTNFAKTRNPTPDDTLGFRWEETTAGKLRHLKLTTNPVMEDDLRATTRVFWESLPLRINNLMNN